MKSVFNDFYRGKKVLVTGHTGFKGSWLSIWLKELGAEVIGYALDPYTERDNFVLSGIKDKITDIRGDIRDIEKLREVFNKYEPEIVFHLAAQPLVRLSYDIPRETFEQNVMGSINVLECAREGESVREVIVVTSDKCYENKEWIWGYRENDPMGGYDPYSASKGCAELVVSSYINSFFNPEKFNLHNKAVASARAGNVIGGGDWAKDRIVPDCIRAIEKDIPIEIRSPRAVRPWQHVLEPLSGYLWLGARLLSNPRVFSSPWNFGPQNESIIPVSRVVENIISNYGKGEWIDRSNPEEPHEAKLLNLDCSKAFHILDWKPTLNIDECFKLTVDWYKDYNRQNVYDLCVKQIDEYISAAESKNTWAK